MIRNTFSELKDAFNTLVESAENALARAKKNARILFVIDGTDKLRGEDTSQFFVRDAEQLISIDAKVVYTAPISLKYEGNLVNKLDADLVLPMIKLQGPGGAPSAEGVAAMRKMLLLRADRSLFASEADIDTLVGLSGGHPRELLRLLKLCCEYAELSTFDAPTIEKAAAQLASEYRRFLEAEDYEFLVKVDRDPTNVTSDARTRKLLYNLALFEYNDGSWRRSHPVVRRLEGYRRIAGRS